MEEQKKTKYIFIILVAFSVMLIVLSMVKDGLMNPMRNTVGIVLEPMQTGVNRLGLSIYNELKMRVDIQDLEKENQGLRDRISVLTEENNVLKQNDEELSRLRALYKMDQEYLQYQKVGAHVIAKDSENWFQVFRIDKGSKDGIRVDQNVIGNGGLVGIVTDVGLNYATVRSIIDDESRVSAMGLTSGDVGIVAGDLTQYEQGRLRITDFAKDATVQDGDRIVTSNISSKFMPGILIGYAVDIKEDNERLSKNGYLIPAANFEDLREVLVVLDVKSDSFRNDDGSAELLPAEDTQPETESLTDGAEESSGARETAASSGSSVPETNIP